MCITKMLSNYISENVHFFFPFLDFSTIRIAKKPAIKLMKAATPPFAAKEPAADEVVEEETEVVGRERKR